jgi:hypothetical protein
MIHAASISGEEGEVRVVGEGGGVRGAVRRVGTNRGEVM